MKGIQLTILIALCTGVLLTAACSHVVSRDASLPLWHPEPMTEGRVACTECHEDQVRGVVKPYETFNHSGTFIQNHRLYAPRDERLCSLCHKSAFCNECHARKSEIKPSIRYGERPDREFMHRGDYLTRHRIDAKTDPTSCFRCHGRTNNEQCRSCHK